MAQFTADAAISFSYYRDPVEVEALDQSAIQRDLGDRAVFPRCGTLADCGHLLLARDRRSGQHLALLAARDAMAGEERILLLDAGVVAAESVRWGALMQRLVALAMLRIAGHAPIPRVVACCITEPAWLGMLQRLAGRFSSAQVFPTIEPTPIPLAAARLARQIARSVAPRFRYDMACAAQRGGKVRHGSDLSEPATVADDAQIDVAFGRSLGCAGDVVVLLDMRGQDEEVIIADARRIFRARGDTAAISPRPRDRGYGLPEAVSAICARRSSLRAEPAEEPTQ